MKKTPQKNFASLNLLSALVILVSLSLTTLLPKQILPIDPQSLSGEYDTSKKQGDFHGDLFASLETKDVLTNVVLGANDNDDKLIMVDLGNQSLYAFEGNKMVYNFLISSGKWGRTPTGIFHIWGKFRYTKMEGGSKLINTYYYLPNVPYVMFFDNDKIAASRGFSLHGTYWHENFGHPMSHGCVNMKTEEAGIIYEWSNPTLGENKSGRATEDNPGTKIIIFGTAPKE